MAKMKMIKGVEIKSMPTETGMSPTAFYDGKAPKTGDAIGFVIGVTTYTGTVAEAIEADGNVMVEFKDGLKPV